MKIDLQRFLGSCSCGHAYHISVEGSYIESKSSRYLSELLQHYKCLSFTCDSNTKKAEETLNEYFYRNKVTKS